MGVEHDSLDVHHVSIVLESSAVETNLLAHLGYLLSVILREEVELEDTFGHIRRVDQVYLKNLGLEVAFVWAVSFQGLEEECGALLDLVELEEGVDTLVDVSLWWALVSVGNHLGEVDSGLWVDWHDLAQDLDEVWDMAGLLAVWHNLVELIGLDEALDDLVWGSGLLIDAQGHLRVGLPDEIAEFVGHREFALFDPVFNQVHFVLLDDWSSELNGLDSIQFSGLQQRVEVDQKWGWSSSLW